MNLTDKFDTFDWFRTKKINSLSLLPKSEFVGNERLEVGSRFVILKNYLERNIFVWTNYGQSWFIKNFISQKI